MTALEMVRETIKLPLHALKGHLSGTVLELTKDTKTSYEYKRIDLSKYDFFFRGLDADGFLNFEILPVNVAPQDDEAWKKMRESPDFKPTPFNPRRRRQHGNIVIPVGYSLYLEVPTKLGGTHKVYVNHRKNFLIKVETYRGGARLHNLGELDDPKSWIARFKAKFDEWHDWLPKADIKKKLRDARMFDSQKMDMGLKILEQEKFIKKRGDAYASVNLPVPPATESSNEPSPAPVRKKKSAHEKTEKEQE
jgi:hypothetical protein